MAEVIAVFDLEGTLCQGGQLIWRAFIRICSRQPFGIFRISTYILSQMVLNYLGKLGLMGEHRARLHAITGMASLLKGLSQEDMNHFAATLADRVMAVLRWDIVETLKEHKQQGHRVLLVSNLFQPLLEAVGKRLEMDHVVATGLELDGARYTGRVSTPICLDEQRATMVKEYLEQAGIEVDFAQSFAYGDTKWDRPALEMVGHPVAVYPDEELRAYAQSQGWRIIG